MLLQKAHEWLGWPGPQQVFSPLAGGARFYADFAKQKIGEALKRRSPGLMVETGVLVPDPASGNTTSPLAVVCQFTSGATAEQLEEAHRLAWNFSRTALLVTLEPQRLIAWSCHQDPSQDVGSRQVCELPSPPEFSPSGTAKQRNVRDLLHWVSLITGHIQRKLPEKFPVDGRADALLLKNLKDIRKRLINAGLNKDYCHDLLARIIFTQFLFHRTDSDGKPFFSKSMLDRRCDGALSIQHDDLASILADKRETYSLFRWLDDRFNGDLFPGHQDQSAGDREAAWQAEEDAVADSHLKLLAELVSGTIDTTDRQLLLWPQYSFDTIPLEFISSVYEVFLKEERDTNKAFYTPSFLVDYLLDAVLPWDGEKWDLRILDPACGSGIFLVKAFQRLIYRWRRNNGREPLVSDLKPILANNIVGVDIHPDAVRVACFSLYLAMADAIDPKHYVTREKVFPRLRGSRLICQDFFDESTSGFRTKEDANTFDLILGNAPWGDGSIKTTSDPVKSSVVSHHKTKEEKTKAQIWAEINRWPVVNYDIGPLFVVKGAILVKETSNVAMVQPASTLLYHRAPIAIEFRKKLFQTYRFSEVTNFAIIRKDLFDSAIGRACIIVFAKEDSEPSASFDYHVPKRQCWGGKSRKSRNQGITIDPQDTSPVSHDQAANDPLVWTVLALGGCRDLNLIKRLAAYPSLRKLEEDGKVMTRLGVIPGDQAKALPNLRNLPYFEATQFPDHVFLDFDVSGVPLWDEPKADERASTNFEAFKQPQMLIKQSYSAKLGRFRAAIVRSKDPIWGTICKKTYSTIRDLSTDIANIRSACLIYNSQLATYFLALTSSRFPDYNTEVPTNELLSIPLPKSPPELKGLNSFTAIDEIAIQLFSLTTADRILIEDLLNWSIPPVLRATGAFCQPTVRKNARQAVELEISGYARTFCRVLKSTFGKEKQVSATIYQEPDKRLLPVRMITIHLDWPGRGLLSIEHIDADGLLEKLAEFHQNIIKRQSRSANSDQIAFQRVAFLFHTHEAEHGRVRNLTIIKPDQRRYWTRTLAMRDADDLASAILRAAGWKGPSK